MSEIRVDESEEGDLLVGVDGDRVSIALTLSGDADPDDVEETIRTAYQEARHSARVRRGGRSD